MLEAWYAAFVFVKILGMRKNIDIVVPIFPPSLFFVFVNLILPRRVCRVGIVHDLQGVHLASKGGSSIAAGLRWLIKLVEEKSFRACDKLIVLSNSMKAELSSNFCLGETEIEVRYPFSNLPELDGGGARLEDVLPSGRQHVVYAGALGEKQNPGALADALRMAVNELPDVEFHIFSEGPEAEKMKKNLADAGRNIHFHGLVPEEDLAELYYRASVQVVPQAPGTGSGSMPSKLPNILVSGRPILAICDADSELAEVVKSFSAGECCESWEPARVCSALRKALSYEMSSDSSAHIRSAFSLDAIIKSILTTNRKLVA